jgi:hypothetical protein
MDLSLRQLEQAVSIRRQIDVLERRFAGLVGGGRATTSAGRKTGGGRRRRPCRQQHEPRLRRLRADAGPGFGANVKLEVAERKLAVAAVCLRQRERDSAI